MTIKLLLKILLKPRLIILQVIALILHVFGNILAVAIPLLASVALDQFFLQKHLGNNEIIILITIIVLTLIVPPITAWLNSYLGERVALDLKNLLINKTLNLSPADLIKNDQGKFYTIFTNDVVVVKNTLTNAIPSVIMSIIMLVGSVIFMYRLNANLSIAIFITIPLIALFVVIIFRKVIKYFKEQQKIRDRINKTIDENIKASMLIRVFVAEKTEENKFNNVNTASYNLGLEIVKKISLVFPVLNITMYVGQLIVLLVGGMEAISGRLSIGEISAFNNYVIMFTMPFLILSFMSTLIGQFFASTERINSVLMIKEKKKQFLPPIESFKSIEFKNFGFTFNDKIILKDINFVVNKGEKIGIIGMTGSGKTMFVESILKFVDEFDGEFLINKISVREQDYTAFRKQIGFVSQKNFILSSSIYNNIDFYRNLNKEDIEKAAKASLVEEFADKYKDRLEHEAGERGDSLSGGQKQRLTIARALAGNPQILILDDSTSKLDMNTENQLMDNINKYYPNTTIIIVAQKIASIRKCDKIYVMENGTFSINGNHDYLINNSFLYQEIDLTQSNYHHE